MDERWLFSELERLEFEQRKRELVPFDSLGAEALLQGKGLVNFASNDYLNLSQHKEVKRGAREAISFWGTGAGASRLLSGTTGLHEALESALSSFTGYPSALLFGSGYLTNLGVITTLFERHDHLFLDRNMHASAIDAVRLTGASFSRFAHNDPDHLEKLLRKCSAKKKAIITESVFSMDGDFAPLPQLSFLAEKYEAILMVDEAHAIGLFGPHGEGCVFEQGLQEKVSLCVGTLSKALGSYGGFLSCKKIYRDFFVNKARPFIYSTAPAPALLGAALSSLSLLKKNPFMGRSVLEKAALFRKRLNDKGISTMNSSSHIVPVLVGESGRAKEISEKLLEEGIFAPPIRHPTVPLHEARLRFSFCFNHRDEEVERAAQEVVEALAR